MSDKVIGKKLLIDIKNRGVTRQGGGYTGIYPINVNEETSTISFEPREFTEKFNELDTSISSITQTLNTKQNKIINGSDCGINGNNQIYLLPKWKDIISTNKTNIATINSHLEFRSDSFNIVNNNTKFSVDSNTGNAYTQKNGGTWKQLAYFEKTNKRLVLPKNTKIGVVYWGSYKQMYEGVVDIDGNTIDFESLDYVSNNEGPYNGFSRSYINYVDFYLPSNNNTAGFSMFNVNITTTETPIPGYFVNNKQVYGKYVSGTFQKDKWVTLASNVDTLVMQSVNIFSSNNWDRFNINGGWNGYLLNNNYASAYFKIYQDNSNRIQAYLTGDMSETFTFRGVIYYTKI